ncbi:hypothetical protein R3P38DRAFT_3117192, partial [Favolaschia claudopus]
MPSILTEDDLLNTMSIALSRLKLGVTDASTVERHLQGKRGKGNSFYIGVLQKIAVLDTDPFRHVTPGFLLYLRDKAQDHFRNEVTADCRLRIHCRGSQLILVHNLHSDYLTARSMFFRRRLSFRSIARSIDLAIDSEWIDVYNPPHVQSFLLLLEWLYFGSTDAIEAAIRGGVVGSQDILMTIAFLELTSDEADAMAMVQALQAGVLRAQLR